MRERLLRRRVFAQVQAMLAARVLRLPTGRYVMPTVSNGRFA